MNDLPCNIKKSKICYLSYRLHFVDEAQALCQHCSYFTWNLFYLVEINKIKSKWQWCLCGCFCIRLIHFLNHTTLRVRFLLRISDESQSYHHFYCHHKVKCVILWHTTARHDNSMVSNPFARVSWFSYFLTLLPSDDRDKFSSA